MGRARVSCSEYSFPGVAGQDERIGIVKLLGFELVDLSLFLADGSELAADPGATAARLRGSLERHELASEDLFSRSAQRSRRSRRTSATPRSAPATGARSRGRCASPPTSASQA